jgi:uncharacterized protein
MKMEDKMLKFNTCIGQAATNKKYFLRTLITNRIWDKLQSGHNLLMVAPRRVGKTSIMNYLLDNPETGYIVLYEIVESVNNENEFYKRLFKKVINELHGIERTKARLSELISKIPFIKGIKFDGVELEKTEISYFDEFKKIIEKIDLEGEKIILMIDEFSQTVENIIRDENVSSAIHFLETNRELRQTPSINKNIQFIYAGSVGLENIVSRIETPKLINDILPVVISPLNKTEVRSLIENIIKDSGVVIDDDVFEYILKKIEWYIPFYFQLLLSEIENILNDNDDLKITNDIVDRAILNALKQRNHFEHWYIRLRTTYQGAEFSFIKELLSYISENEVIESNEIIDLSEKYSIRDIYKNLLNTLIYDGYINNNDDPKIYRFNSPLLREWWRNNV